MEEKALLDWRNTNEEVYSKYKMVLESQLTQPFHQTILDMGDDTAEPLKSVIANLADITSKEGVDADKLYSKESLFRYFESDSFIVFKFSFRL